MPAAPDYATRPFSASLLLLAAMLAPAPLTIAGAQEADSDAARPASDLLTTVYPVQDLLTRIVDELGLSPKDAEACLQSTLLQRSELPAFAANDLVAGRKALAVFDLDGENDRPPQVIARLSAAEHQRLADSLQSLRRHGFQQVLIETQWIALPEQALGKAAFAVGWQAGSSHQPSLEAAPGEAKDWSLIATLTPQQRQALAAAVAEEQRANRVSAPKVAVFNGQSARVATGVQRPFVVGVRDQQPQVQVYSCGYDLRIRPELLEGDQVRLDCTASLSEITEVKVLQLAQPDSRQPASIQVPRVDRVEVSTTATLAMEQTLAIVTRNPQPDAELVLLLLTVRQPKQ